MKIWFNRYLGKPAHVKICRLWSMPPEEASRIFDLLAAWTLNSKRYGAIVLRRKDVPVAAAVLRLQGYEVEIES